MDLTNQIILTFLIMFVVLYVVFNHNNISNGNIFGEGNDLKKPLIIAMIGVLLFYLFMTWDKEDNIDNVPKYRITNNRVRNNMNNNMSDLFQLPMSSANEFDIFKSPQRLNNNFGIGFV